MSSRVYQEKKNGKTTYRIAFYNANNERKFVRLGESNKRAAEGIAAKVQDIVNLTKASTTLGQEQNGWIDSLGNDLYDRLAKAGILNAKPRQKLGEFLDSILEERKESPPNSLKNYRNAVNNLKKSFGEATLLRDITFDKASEWRRNLVEKGLASATISKRVKFARQFLREAIDQGIITDNPFQKLKAGGEQNTSRIQYVDVATIEKVMAVTDRNWQTIIALCRFAGLRCPSEVLSLRWEHIDWNAQKITIPSPKTAGSGKSARVIPIFRRLKPYLEAARLAASEKQGNNSDPDTGYVVLGKRDTSNCNLRTQFNRILARAHVAPWERLFHNLRASMQMDLAKEHPAYVVANWAGNSVAVGAKHYLMPTEADFWSASGGTTVGTDAVEKVAQGLAQHTCAPTRQESEKAAIPRTDCGFVRVDANQDQFAEYTHQDSNLKPSVP